MTEIGDVVLVLMAAMMLVMFGCVTVAVVVLTYRALWGKRR